MEKALYLTDLNSDFLDKAKELAPSAIFLREASFDAVSTSLLKEVLPDCRLNILIDIFSTSDLAEDMIETMPIEAQGRDVSFKWYTGICPNNKRIREYRLNRIEALITNPHVFGIWLDELHYPTFWQAAEPEIFDTCYCSTCLSLFTSSKLEGDKLPTKLEDIVDAIDGQYYTEWLEFKSESITSFAKEVLAKVRTSGKNTKLGFFAVPWTDQDFGTGNKRLLGQNLDDLTELFDYISPMLYSSLLGKDSAWIQSVLDYFSQFTHNLYPALFSSAELPSLSTNQLHEIMTILKGNHLKGALVMDFAGLINSAEAYQLFKELA